MDCPGCSASNREGAKFCLECGYAFAVSCASCGAALEPRARFCDECGTAREPSAAPSATPVSTGSGSRPAAVSGEEHVSLPPPFASGRYKFLRFLGEGAKKRVYLARDGLLDREVALAIFKTEGLDETGMARVRREAQAMGRLGEHAHVVTVFDVGQEGHQIYVVSQFMAGGDVEGLLRESDAQRLPIEQALLIVEQICSGLEHAHARSVIHRDLKPGNVWLTEDGTAMIGDFGLAVALDRSRLTQEGMMVGTPSYMPPEQAVGGEVTSRSDLYSLGAMFYEMVTGRQPFVGDDLVAVISQHLNTRPMPPSWHSPEVSAELEALILALLAKAPNDRPADAAAVGERVRELRTAPAASPAAPVAGFGAVDWGLFIGRGEELESLKARVDAALGAKGSLVMIVGEPGIGKTRLTEEVCVYARVRGAQVIVGHCNEGDTGMPYLPFVEAIRQYVADRPEAELRDELGSGASDVARLVSEIRERLPDLPRAEPGGADTERRRLFDAVTSFLVNAAKATPLVLVLDDLHWADRPSLLLLQQLARRVPSSRLLLIGTYRDMELERRHPLTELLADLRREHLYERVLLRGFSVNEVTALMEAIAQHQLVEAGAALAKAIHRETEGNPFFIEETLRHLVESGAIFREEGRWVIDAADPDELGIPEGVREVIGRRLSRLSEACNDLLGLASVLGREFEFDALREMAGLEPQQLVAALEEALAARTVVEMQTRSGATYQFSHALVRQTLYDEMSLPRKQQLHLRAGEAIERVHPHNLTPHIPSLARHYRTAGAIADPVKALDYSEQAGDAAARLYAWEDAATHWAAALALMQEQGIESERRAALVERLGDLMYVSGLDHDQGIAYLEEALRMYEALGNEQRAAQMHSRLGRDLSSFISLDIDRALGHYRAAEAVLSKGPETTALGALYGGMAAALSRALSADEAANCAERAMEIGERLGNEALWVNGAGLLAINRLYQGRVAEWRELSEKAWLVADRLNHAWVAFMSAWTRGSAGLLLQDFGDAARWCERELAKPRVSQAPMQRSLLAGVLASAYVGVGELEKAEELSRDIPGGGPLMEFWTGEWESAEARMRRSVESNRKSGNRADEWAALRTLAELELARDEPASAASVLEDGMKIALDAGDVLRELVNAAMLAVALSQSGRAQHAHPHLERCREILAGGEDWLGVASLVSEAEGSLAAEEERFADADEHFAAAIETARAFSAPWVEARARHWAGRALLEAGNDTDAVEQLDAALETYTSCGAGSAWLEAVLADKLRVQGIDSGDVRGSIHLVQSTVQARQPDLQPHAAPDGTVTLVFSDMEGFTTMTERLGDQQAHQVILEHNRIVREQLSLAGGYEVELQGDGFLLAFGSARRALQCAIGIQRALEAHNDGGVEPIRVRIGLHTGEAIKDADKFFGKAVILAARIAAKANGGEILVSSLLKQLTESSGDLRFGTPQDVELKGISETQRVFPVEWRETA